MKRKPYCATRAPNQRGTASVEIVVMLPVFVLLLFAAVHFATATLRAHAASQSARACAWDYALASCDGGRVRLCAGVRTDRGEAALPDQPRGALDKLEGMPLIGGALTFLFGEQASAETSFSRPRFLESKSDAVTTSHMLVCAPVVESWGDKVGSALCDLTHQLLHVNLAGC